MCRLRRSIKKYDIIKWGNTFLQAGISQDLHNFSRAKFLMQSPSGNLEK